MIAILLIILAVALGPGLINRFLAPDFPVHERGIIVISGASSGIGKHAAFDLADQRPEITVYAGVRSQKDVAALTKEAQDWKTQGRLKGALVPVILDVTKEETILAVKQKVIASGLPLIGVVNNAGVSARFPAECTNRSVAKDMFEINYFGAVDLTHHLLPLVRQSKGRVVFVSSVAAYGWHYGSAIYSSTKRAIEAFVDTLRLEMTEFEVSVTSVIPGYIKTSISTKGMTEPQDIGSTPEEVATYRTFWELVTKNRAKAFANVPGPEVTTEVIRDALFAKQPKPRYVVGPATSMLSGYHVTLLTPLLPERLFDYLSIREFMKIKTELDQKK